MSAFLVDYARNTGEPVLFRRIRTEEETAQDRPAGSTVLAGSVCPVCGKGQMRENSAAFGCTEAGCHCTVSGKTAWRGAAART